MLLLVETAWSSTCRHIREHVLTREAVVARISGRFVPVHVDADWRPDIADRYGLGAWPTLLALTPEGHVLGGGVGDGEWPALEAWLDRTVELFAAHDGRLAPPRPVAAPSTLPLSAAIGLAEACTALAEAVDPAQGTFDGDDQPILLPALAALACASCGVHADLAEPAVRTIDRLLASPRWDGTPGILRCRGASPYEPGETFGRLDEQAEWIRLLACACACEPRPPWRRALEAAVKGLRAAFAHPSRPAWAFSADREPRTADRTPATSNREPALFVDANARACRALCAAADVLEAPEVAAAAIAAIEHIVPAAYSRGSGVAHVLTDRPHGPALLTDAVLVAHALLAAQPWRDTPVYRDLADELVRSVRSRLSLDDGALTDRRVSLAGANAVGRLADPFRPLEANADLARALLHLPLADPAADPHADTGADVRADADAVARRDAACGILRAVHGEVRTARGFAAPLALAWAAVLSPDHPVSLW